MHYNTHPEMNVSVRPHQVNHYVRTFDALLRNYLSIFMASRVFIRIFYLISINI